MSLPLALEQPDLPTDILVLRNEQARRERLRLRDLLHESDPDVQRYREERERRIARGALALVPATPPPMVASSPQWLRPARVEQPTKICEQCGVTITKPAVESRANWARRTTCGRVCRNRRHARMRERARAERGEA